MTKYYDILGLKPGASDDDIKQAYRKLASKFHPDKVPEAEKAAAEVKFKQVKEAYETLSDPQKRRIVDQGGDPNSQDSGFGGFHHGGGMPSEMEEILRQFRQAHGFQGGASFRQMVETNFVISLRDAFFGITKQFTFPGGLTKEVVVPPGAPDGYRIQVDVNKNLTAIVNIRVQDSRFAIRPAADCPWHMETVAGRHVHVLESGDIETSIGLDALDLILGAWTTVEGIDGEKISVRVPAGFNPEQRLRVKAKGSYHWYHELNRHAGRGDIFVKINPQFKQAQHVDPVKVKQLYDISTGATKIDTKI